MEQISCAIFMKTSELSARQLCDLNDGIGAMEAYWNAVRADPCWQSAREWPLFRCILSALCVRDILRASGRRDAIVVRSGLDVRRVTGDSRALTIGTPTAPRLESKWNAHMAVRLGTLLFDPSFGQTKREWNQSPHCAAFLTGAPGGHVVDIEDGCDAVSTTLHQYWEGAHGYQVTYFKLPLNVELRTRNWRSAPDAQPERRQALVRKAVSIRLAQLTNTDGRVAA